MDSIVIKLAILPIHMWVLFLIALLIFIAVSVALVFHWGYYGVKENPRVFVRGLYFIISIIILSSALLLLSLYSAT